VSDPTGETVVDALPAEAPAEVETVHGCPVTGTGGQRVAHVPVDRLLEVAQALRDEGFDFCADVTAVDYLTHPGRHLPDDVTAQRYELVVNLLSTSQRSRLRLRVQVPGDDPTVPSLFGVWPGAEAMEREAFDMYGLVFTDHPDLTRILMPEDWEGHPLRKDYATGRVPVQFKHPPATR
jgi:NADH-quinone oxidoreductase subunit C